ncbi:MAG TPA: phosphoribosylaminoimidazolesuccinocarboxamide synthase [Actinomycetota bacterium]|nr:phosphoribosylaminoimidazolesuccinocarboxamide synthase [Actinomycetota bacterium]
MTEALLNVDLPFIRSASGKVREVFDLADGRLLFVATDRISAYDVVMSQGIPQKGRILTQLSRFWFDLMAEICPNHLAANDELPDAVSDDIRERSLVVDRLEMLPVEFVIRGYLAGSGWKEYQTTGTVCEVKLPAGLRESDRLPEPIFTPATKATSGHDENISEDMAADIIGGDVLKIARGYALDIYERASDHAATRGIILADTKFEFGILGGKVVLADEVLTPDSSRFWPADSWEPGRSQPSFDKQFLRDWLDSQGWDHSPPPPDLPADVIEGTQAKYVEALERLTGEPVDAGGVV